MITKASKRRTDLIHVLGICTYKELVIFSSGSVTCSAKYLLSEEKNVGMHRFRLTERAQETLLLFVFIFLTFIQYFRHDKVIGFYFSPPYPSPYCLNPASTLFLWDAVHS